ncbi:hypothetical protein [Pectobacterium carotovorum]|uniref:hypothetical protein n=1 Tax=Pectobacterium carotovorum TaxID=554 RepID=UPI00208C4CF6|nr:hypothetical protein [Pectobacterium carotovorum]GKV89295.1 hypothetical protein PEC301619_12770 [Pectobacterium carotovorum subsp. carotovorum]
MNAYELYDAAIENAEMNDAEISAKYFSEYADGAMNTYISDDVAKKIAECAIEFRDNGNGSSDLYHMVEKPLSEIEI